MQTIVLYHHVQVKQVKSGRLRNDGRNVHVDVDVEFDVYYYLDANGWY